MLSISAVGTQYDCVQLGKVAKDSLNIRKEPVVNQLGGLPKEELPEQLTKENKLLYCLGVYKFLTIEQMLRLGIAKSQPNIPTGKLKKAGYINSVKVKSEETDSLINVYYLTKNKGAVVVESLGLDLINYPTRTISNVNQFEHKRGVSNHAIELSRHGIDFIKKDIDRTGVRSVKATRVPLGDSFVEPDLILKLNNGNYYTLEYERGKDTGKSTVKLQKTIDLMRSMELNKLYDTDTKYRTLMVFDNATVMKNAMSSMKEKTLSERVLFKLLNDDIYNGWVTCFGEKRCLY